jgi:PhoPQ-activated pathogenicity-related protein
MVRTSFHWPRFGIVFLLAMLCGCSHAAPRVPSTPATPPSALDDYIARAEPHYQWKKISENGGKQNKVTTLTLTSQTWKGRDWTHRVEIIEPQKNDFPDTALVLASYGLPLESLAAQLLARQAGATVINVENVPNQPLFDKREDALIAYTFQKYLDTGDKTWPLLLPMTKSVIAAMDAVQEYSAKSLEKPFEKFVVCGASKRGWTSWLVAAADSKLHPKRVIGIVPLVYNNLNIPMQLPHQLESWGEYSAMIGAYKMLDLKTLPDSRLGKELLAIVDPFSYRERFVMPMLLINGTNDPYWTPDATQFYLSRLPRRIFTPLYWAPNSGHDLANDFPDVMSTAAAFFRLVAAQQQIPFMMIYSTGTPQGDLKIFTVRFAPAEQRKKELRFWTAVSPTRDFRNAKWETIPAKSNAIEYFCALPAQDKQEQYRAVFAEAIFMEEPALRISSEINIWKTTQAN